MPKITITTDKQVLEVPENYALHSLGEDHDTSILFGCRDGACGACLIRVKEGAEFLSPMSDDEREFLRTMSADPYERLACQCVLKGGDITVEVS
jgi:ferredoxin